MSFIWVSRIISKIIITDDAPTIYGVRITNIVTGIVKNIVVRPIAIAIPDMEHVLLLLESIPHVNNGIIVSVMIVSIPPLQKLPSVSKRHILTKGVMVALANFVEEEMAI